MKDSKIYWSLKENKMFVERDDSKLPEDAKEVPPFPTYVDNSKVFRKMKLSTTGFK
jgi:hypothetical protein